MATAAATARTVPRTTLFFMRSPPLPVRTCVGRCGRAAESVDHHLLPETYRTQGRLISGRAREQPPPRRVSPRPWSESLRAAGVRAAVAARVARARANHPAAALRAFDCVLPAVEERGLAGWRSLGRRV